MTRKAKWLWAIGLVFILIVVACTGAAWWAFWRPLPALEGNVSLTGLQSTVTIDRDSHGVPWIQASSLGDLMTAQGYALAQDRLWQMDLLRRIASGQISEIVGPMALDLDREERTLGLYIAADAAAAHMDPQTQKIIEAYCRGVNAYIEQHQSSLPFEFTVLRYKLAPWKPRDTFLISAYMWQTLTTTWKAKLNRARITAKLGPDRARDLFVVDSPLDHILVGATTPQKSEPQTTKTPRQSSDAEPISPPYSGDSRIHATEDSDAPSWLPSFLAQFRNETSQITGSNNFVVSGAHTASGKPILANDTHLEFSMPGIWYMLHLTAPGWNVAGFTFPGCPLIVIGHNDRIAWGFTNSNADVQDLYTETFNPANSLQFKVQFKGNDKWLNARARTEIIHVRHKPDETLQVITTRHGPIVSRDPNDANRAYALRWTLFEPGSLDFSFPLLGAASDWNSFVDVMQKIQGPGQNAVYADVDGNIGYILAAKVPIRASGHGELPVDGSNDNSEWTGYIPFDQLPKVLNPPAGIMATANARTVGPGYKYFLTDRWAGPERTERMYQLLTGRTGLRPSDANEIQNDIVSLPDQFLAQQLQAASEHATSSDSRTTSLIGSLDKWNGSTNADSTQTSFLEFTRHALIRYLLAPYLGNRVTEYELWEPDADYDNVWWRDKVFLQNVLTDRPAAWLPKEFQNYDQLLMKCADEAAAHILPRGPSENLSDAAWGHFHFLEILHPLGQKGLLRDFLSIGPMGQSGTLDTVRAMGYRHGPSMRLVADLSNFDNSLMEIPAGESGQPESPYYRDQFSDWFAGRAIPAPFTPAAADKARAHRLVLLPAQRPQ
jgi:penicillin G amidase